MSGKALGWPLIAPLKFIVGLALGLVLLFVIVTTLGAFGPYFIFLVPILGGVFLFDSDNAVRKKLTWAQAAGRVVWISFMGGLLTLGFVAPFRLPVLWMADRWVAEAEGRAFLLEGATAGVLNGMMGYLGVAFGILIAALRWFQADRTISQIRELPTAKARSVSIGMAELTGVARRAETEALRQTKIEKSEEGKAPNEASSAILVDFSAVDQKYRRWERFWLEDDTGRILIDPRDADYWDGAADFFWRPTRAIGLERSAEKKSDGKNLSVLRDGDPVYAVGAVEALEEETALPEGAPRLALGPRKESPTENLIARLLLLREKGEGSDAMHDLFFVANLSEAEALRKLVRGRWRIWIWAALWAALSAPLLAYAPAGFRVI